MCELGKQNLFNDGMIITDDFYRTPEEKVEISGFVDYSYMVQTDTLLSFKEHRHMAAHISSFLCYLYGFHLKLENSPSGFN